MKARKTIFAHLLSDQPKKFTGRVAQRREKIAHMTSTWKPRRSLLFSLALVAVVAAGWLWFTVFPEHWMRRVDLGTVKVDDRPVQAEIYFGNPTFYESDIVALVHLKDGIDYFLDFPTERVREGKPSEYVRLLGGVGVWCFRCMQDDGFREPLPSRNLNQFRIAAQNGRIVTIQF